METLILRVIWSRRREERQVRRTADGREVARIDRALDGMDLAVFGGHSNVDHQFQLAGFDRRRLF